MSPELCANKSTTPNFLSNSGKPCLRYLLRLAIPLMHN